MLGKGAFGKVSLGIHKLSGKFIAMKCINKEFMSDESSKAKVMKEVGILKQLRHSSTIRFYS
jgi:serine/threonine protein kinase